MSEIGTVTTWMHQLEQGERQAAQRLWDFYYQRLILYARGRLNGADCRMEDEEDVVAASFFTFCQAMAAGRLNDLQNRDDLWRTLILITSGKVVDLRRRQGAQKRSAPKDTNPLNSKELDFVALENAMSRESDPAAVVEVDEAFEKLLSKLPDERLRAVALCKLEGMTVDEIASQLGCSARTVTREIALIRKTWETELGPTDGTE